MMACFAIKGLRLMCVQMVWLGGLKDNCMVVEEENC